MVVLDIPAYRASQHLLLAVSVVVPADRAGPCSLALGKLFFCVFAYVIPAALLFVAGVAEMSVAPAKPLSYAATKFAFEFDKVLTVLGTVLNRNVATTRTYQLLRLE